jgi:hypothetical protein
MIAWPSHQVTVARRGVDFHRVVVHFANSGDQEVEMRHTIPAVEKRGRSICGRGSG